MIDLLTKGIVNLSVKMKGNLKRTIGNLFSPLGAQGKDIGAASQTLQTGVKFH